MMKVLTELTEINGAATVKRPTHDEVRLAISNRSDGLVLAVYTHRLNRWFFQSIDRDCDIEATAIEHYELFKKLAEMAMDDSWFYYSEMYIYTCPHGDRKPLYSLYGVVVEE